MAHKDALARRKWKREYNRKNKDKINAYERARRATNPAAFRATRLKTRYGIDHDGYAELYRSQGGLCALCKEYAAVDVDHCHQTGRVRGLLCRSCNVGLGQFGDSVEALERAISYLKGAET